MNLEQTIVAFIDTLPKDEYVNITAAMQDETSKQRVIEHIKTELHKGKKIKDICLHLDLSMF